MILKVKLGNRPIGSIIANGPTVRVFPLFDKIKGKRETDDLMTAKDVAKVSPKQAAQNLRDAGYDVEVTE